MRTWRQYNIEFPDPETAESVAASVLFPALVAAQEAGEAAGWWFIRKRPWKLRFLSDVHDQPPLVGTLDGLAATGEITGWCAGIYEPETIAFGGDDAMDAAHRLFHHDSRHILARAAPAAPAGAPGLGRRETTVLLCSAMLRAAGLDWYEQGDVWAKVGAHRPPADGSIAPERAALWASAMRTLMTASTARLCAVSRPLSGCGEWVSAFEETGRSLAGLARDGRLGRGLRLVLAHHILFHANRVGLGIADQSVLAALAVSVVFHSDLSHPPSTSTTRVRQVTTVSEESSVPAAELRDELAGRLRQTGAVRTASVERAFRNVPRHLFLPGVPLADAYANRPVYTKHGEREAISAASQPEIVAGMAEQLAVSPGHRILEIGAGTGYNAALLAAIAGENGTVVTVDVDEDLVTGARQHLARAGAGNVEVVLGDGALGYPHKAPYDRIIATVGAWEVPDAWLRQLAPGGRLVVPLRIRGAYSRSIAFERQADRWTSRDSMLAVFMPLRGIGDDARRYLALTPGQEVTLQVHKDHDANEDALVGVLDTSRREAWTGVVFPPEVPYEWMDLWLCLRLANPLMRMNTTPAAAEHGQVTPMFPWGSMATTDGSDLAYLTTRPAPPAADGGKLYEVGVIGHGPHGARLADLVAAEIVTWDQEHRQHTARFEMPDNPEATNAAAGRFVVDRPGRPVTVVWE